MKTSHVQRKIHVSTANRNGSWLTIMGVSPGVDVALGEPSDVAGLD